MRITIGMSIWRKFDESELVENESDSNSVRVGEQEGVGGMSAFVHDHKLYFVCASAAPGSDEHA